MIKVDKPTEKAAAYGALYMNNGEKINEAKDNIAELSKQKPDLWFFDIICTPNQMPAGKEWAPFLTGYMQGLNADMPKENIIIGVTTDAMDRPAFNLLRQFQAGMTGAFPQSIARKEGRRYVYIAGKVFVKEQIDEKPAS
jgi:hypothetical protein